MIARNLLRRKRLQLWNRDGPYCQICGRKFENFTDKEVTLDHIHPQFLGGGHHISNLRLACGPCNLNYAKEFHHFIKLKEALVAERRKRLGALPKQKFVLMLSSSSTSVALVPKGVKNTSRELIKWIPLARPFEVVSTKKPAVVAVTAPATAAAPSFATSPNVVSHAPNKNWIGITPFVPAVPIHEAAHQVTRSAGAARTIAAPTAFDATNSYEPMDTTD